MGKKKNSKKNLAIDTELSVETPMEVLNKAPVEIGLEQPFVQADIMVEPAIQEEEKPNIQTEEPNIQEEKKPATVQTEEPATVQTDEPDIQPEEPTTVQTNEPKIQEEEEPNIQTEKPNIQEEEPDIQEEEEQLNKTEDELLIDPDQPVVVPDLQQAEETTSQTLSDSLLSEGPLQSSTDENPDEEEKVPVIILEKPQELIEVDLTLRPVETVVKEEIKNNSTEEIVLKEKEKNCSSKFKCTIL